MIFSAYCVVDDLDAEQEVPELILFVAVRLDAIRALPTFPFLGRSSAAFKSYGSDHVVSKLYHK